MGMCWLPGGASATKWARHQAKHDTGETVTQWTDEEITAATAGQTVATLFRDTVRSRPDQVALRCKAGDGWEETTFGQYAERACRLATGLAGLEPEQHVAQSVRQFQRLPVELDGDPLLQGLQLGDVPQKRRLAYQDR